MIEVVTGFLYGLVAYVSLAIAWYLIRGCPTEVRWEDHV
jgi:hypothetical protein